MKWKCSPLVIPDLVTEKNICDSDVLDFTNSKNNSFIIKKVTPITDDTTKGSVSLELITTEAVKNEKSGVDIRTDGKISDHVKKYFKIRSILHLKRLWILKKLPII